MIQIYDLRTEYQTHTVTASTRPAFSWKCRNLSGTASYKLAVSSSRALAEKGVGDVFDSGVIAGMPALVEYGGEPLLTRTAYFAKVTVFSGEESAQSEICEFETAPSKADFLGTWMAMPVNNQGGTALFRKRITLKTGRVARARAYICGLGYHELFVNGAKAGNAVLSPAVSDYAKRMFYIAYDILPMLKQGENVFGIEVGHGWLGSKKVLAQFYLDYENGETEEYHSSVNGGWWVGHSPTKDNSVYGGETYDARREDVVPKFWASAEFEPSWSTGWMFTIYSPAPDGELLPQPLEEITVSDTYPAVSVCEKGKGVFVYDVGANIAGWARIRARGERGAKIKLKYGERLAPDGTVNRINLRTAKACDTYILKGEGEEEFAPRFTYHGFQYVQAEICGNAEILSLTGEHVHNNVRIAGSFSCSDENLNKLHEIAVRTELNNQHSVLTDCPQRDERFGWLNDWGSRFYQTVYNCGMERFFPKTLFDISDTQLDGGEIADTAPFYTGGRPADPVCVAYPLLAVLSYTHYGDPRPARENYAGIKKWVYYLLSRSDNYIMDYSYYGDWVYPGCYEAERADGLCISTFYLYWHLALAERVARIAGMSADEKEFHRHAEKCAAAINEKYFNEKLASYSRGSQAENAIALSLGLVPEKHRERVAENLYSNVKEHNHHSTCGNIGYRHLFYMLSEYGHADEVIRVLNNPEYPGWGFMLREGATSVWERWEKEMDVEMDSFDHPMFGSYDAFFYRYLGGIGISDDACGCDKITVAPVCVKELDFVDCSFDTVRGKVVSCWKRENGTINYHIEIPASVTAEIVLCGKKCVRGEGSYDFVEKETD